jgi:hypothetical protein
VSLAANAGALVVMLVFARPAAGRQRAAVTISLVCLDAGREATRCDARRVVEDALTILDKW